MNEIKIPSVLWAECTKDEYFKHMHKLDPPKEEWGNVMDKKVGYTFVLDFEDGYIVTYLKNDLTGYKSPPLVRSNGAISKSDTKFWYNKLV